MCNEEFQNADIVEYDNHGNVVAWGSHADYDYYAVEVSNGEGYYDNEGHFRRYGEFEFGDDLMAKFDIVRKKLETKFSGITLVRIHFRKDHNYAVMYLSNNNVVPVTFRTLQDVIDQFDLND